MTHLNSFKKRVLQDALARWPTKYAVSRGGHFKRYRATGPHRAGVDVNVTPPTGGPVGHPPPIRRPCVTAVRREVNRDTQGHLQNTQT